MRQNKLWRAQYGAAFARVLCCSRDATHKMPHITKRTKHKTRTPLTLLSTQQCHTYRCCCHGDAILCIAPAGLSLRGKNVCVCVCVSDGEVNVPHVCFALSCAVGCTEEENMAGWGQLSRYPVVRVVVCVSRWFRSMFESSVSPPVGWKPRDLTNQHSFKDKTDKTVNGDKMPLKASVHVN